MIVRTLPDRLQLVTQPDHARLARAVMERCAPLRARERRESILRATGEHDAGWAELDAAPLVDAGSGGVVDFVRLPLPLRQGVWPRSVGLLARDPWAAALVAQHALVAYERFRGAPEWVAFFAEMEALRDAHVAASGLPLEELAEDYAFVRLGDLISLAFCTGSPDEARYGEWTLRRADRERILVTPDPFRGEEVALAVEAREVQLPFGSAEQLAAAVRAAATVTLHGVVAGG